MTTIALGLSSLKCLPVTGYVNENSYSPLSSRLTRGDEISERTPRPSPPHSSFKVIFLYSTVILFPAKILVNLSIES